MSPTPHPIREALMRVQALRAQRQGWPALDAAVHAVKALQARRFAGTYADLLAGGQFQAPARFFLDELYGDHDFTRRDAGFMRIAGAIERFFPAQVVATATALAELHAMTETLDHAMGEAWASGPAGRGDARAYVDAWRITGQRAQREAQLRTVLTIGQEMTRLTRTRGLRMALRLMRAPAEAAGLGDLQAFLESGFDTFGEMAHRPGAAEAFLATVAEREAALIDSLFDESLVACETRLVSILGLAP